MFLVDWGLVMHVLDIGKESDMNGGGLGWGVDKGSAWELGVSQR